MKKQIKLLLVDDDEDDILLIEDLLQRIVGFEISIDWAKDFKTACHKIQNQVYDIFLLDFYLGRHNGLELLDEISKKNEDLPAIVLTGQGNTQVDRTAVEKGAYDYLEKSSLSTDALERSIRYAMKHASTLQALRKSEKKYRTVFEHSSEIIFILNTELEIISISHSVENLTGFSLEEIKTLALHTLLENPAEILKIERLLSKTKSIEDYQLNIKTKEQQIKRGLLSCVTEIDQDGDWYIHGIYSDQTDKIRAEKALLQTEKMEATTRFMRVLAHEVRNPLTNINLSTENLLADTTDDYQLSMLDIIKRNAQKIDKIIAEVLYTAQQDLLVLEETDLHQIVLKSIENISDRATFANIKINLDIQHTPTVRLNQDKLLIALNNILLNAVEAMEDSTSKNLNICIKNSPLGSTLSIIDSGVGMTEQQLQRIFEPFFSTKPNGIGLGMAATLAILDAHRAHIEVESAMGFGTHFNILFPTR